MAENRLKEKYVKEIAPELMKLGGYKNINEVPKLEKIVIGKYGIIAIRIEKRKFFVRLFLKIAFFTNIDYSLIHEYLGKERDLIYYVIHK